MSETIQVPASVAWTAFIAFSCALGGAYVLLLRTSWNSGQKADDAKCLSKHETMIRPYNEALHDLREQVIGVTKDVEWLVKANGGTPASKPSNGGGRREARDNWTPEEDQ